MISLVLVSYRSAGLAAIAIGSARAAAAACGEALEVVAVVNSGDEAEAAALAPHCDRLIDPGANLGFAGGLNRGIEASTGEILALANPDIALGRGSFAPLLEAVRSQPRAAVGPVFFWDDAKTLLLPSAEEPRPAELVRRLLAPYPERGALVFRRDLSRARRELARARAGETARVRGLTGALVLVTRDTFRAVGPFDEGYALYYEENDWQRRLRVLGGSLFRAGGSHVVHRFNQSAQQEPRAAAWFAASERRYYLSHFGARGARAMDALLVSSQKEIRLPRLHGPLRWNARATGVVLSPFPYFRPFAYAELPRGATEWSVPAEVLAGIQGTWYARALGERGDTVAEGEIFVVPPS